MDHSSQQAKKVSWNKLHCIVPNNWQAIVKNKSHLIFEQDLSPVLEIRWTRSSGKISPEKQVEQLWAVISKESGGSLIPVTSPLFLDTVKNKYRILTFSRTGQKEPEGAILSCRKCATLILVFFFTRSHGAEKTDLFFKNLDCHSYLNGNGRWHIQDYTFIAPEHFELDTFSFSFGVSKISFKHKNRRLKLCRLAPASEHLRRASFAELFSAFSTSTPEDYQAVDKSTLLFSHQPTLTERLVARLKRRTVYRRAYFKHLAADDRIIGALLEGSSPVEQSALDTLWRSYTIV